MARQSKLQLGFFVFATTFCFGQGTARANTDIPTLETVIAQADSVQSLYFQLPLMASVGFPLQYAEIDDVDSEEADCEKLRAMTFMLGCSASGLQERSTLRSKNSYAAGSSMYRLLEYQTRSDTGLWAASDFGSALNSFEYQWARGGDLHNVSKDFFRKVMEICDFQFRDGAAQENVNVCVQAAGQFLVEMADYIDPNVRNTWVDQVLADTLQIRPTWSGVRFSLSYIGISSSFGFDSIPNAIPAFKENLFKDWSCKLVREDRQAAGCPIV